MYHECNLVHGDLSEYNMLWHQGKIFIIDVSQSVEHAHPYARELLHKDINNVSEFFKKNSVERVISNYQLFLFITVKELSSLIPNLALLSSLKFPITHEDLKHMFIEYLDIVDDLGSHHVDPNHLIMPNGSEKSGSEKNKSVLNGVKEVNSSDDDDDDDDDDGLEKEEEEEEIKRMLDEKVFINSYIPSSLHEISNPHQEMTKLVTGSRESYYVKAVSDMVIDGMNHIQAYKNQEKHEKPKSQLKSMNKFQSDILSYTNDSKTAKKDKPIETDEKFPWRPKNMPENLQSNGLNFMQPIVKPFVLKKYLPPSLPSSSSAVNEDAQSTSLQDMNSETSTSHSDNNHQEDDENDSEDSNSHNDNEDDDEDEDEDNDEESRDVHKKEKYRRCLPSRDDAEVRAKAKVLRKEQAKLAKEQAAIKRQNKIPKHIKKKAIKNTTKK
jgi:hypothetical protein